MFSIGLWLLVAQVLPRVEDPWPTSIGLGFPFAAAGVAGRLADLVFSESSPARRDRISRKAGVYGFRLGLSIYGLALLVQLLSNL
ncbi:MAG TPA: hypothetical protein VFG58_07585 [Solirubrobacterales bacterium]|nr:hypothetical protein [Solirubrobacterales bacterium]